SPTGTSPPTLPPGGPAPAERASRLRSPFASMIRPRRLFAAAVLLAVAAPPAAAEPISPAAPVPQSAQDATPAAPVATPPAAAASPPDEDGEPRLSLPTEADRDAWL